jgi:co-chaperonin GroES (HSP10)
MTLNNLIVEIDSTYNNVVDGVVVNSTIDSVIHINRVANVVDAPEGVAVEVGDKILVHHNIFREKHLTNGTRVLGDYHLEGKRYFVPLLLVYAYKRGDSDWQSLSPFVFVESIKKADVKVGRFIIDAQESNSHKGRENNVGIIRYPNKDLIEMGVDVGDKVVFTPYSEHEYMVDNKILYRMTTQDIVAKI